MRATAEVGERAARPELYFKVHRRTVIWRLVHWSNAASIVAAAVTGIYIANPYYSMNSGYVMAWNRAFHLYAAIVLDVSLLLIAYLYFFSRAEREARLLRPNRENLLGLQEVFLNFVMLGRRKRFDSAKADPLNTLIFVIFHLFLLLQVATGFQLYVAGMESGYSVIGDWWPAILHLSTDWTQVIFGSLAGVRLTHHLMLYVIVGWAMLHIYYEVWRTLTWREGDINIMFGGHKYARQSGSADDQP